jgi:hypothetical protein
MSSQTLDRVVQERFFYLPTLKARKGKKFSLLCQLTAHIAEKDSNQLYSKVASNSSF